jgi:hypothetical protein
MTRLKKTLRNSFAFVAFASAAFGASADDLQMQKSLIGASGSANISNSEYTMVFTLGEEVSGRTSDASNEVIWGYLGGFFGQASPLHFVGGHVNTPAIVQNTVEVGVAREGAAVLEFSEQLSAASVAGGISCRKVFDHLGQEVDQPVSIIPSYDTSGRSVVVRPEAPWDGNSYYEIRMGFGLQTIDGFPLSEPGVFAFVTLLNPQEDNVVLTPRAPQGVAVPTSNAAIPMRVDVPSESLADFSLILLAPVPQRPANVDPNVVDEADKKATQSGGEYRRRLATYELQAFNKAGERVNTLSKTGQLSIGYNEALVAPGSPSVIRPNTLALWVLDTAHKLWVKIPGSANSADRTVTAPITRFTTFALMGGPSGSAADVYVFPNPWRPHGPNAGSGSGQTGTIADGMTFAALPSECRIRIYTISGELVRELRHSDLTTGLPTEAWDGKTSGGQPVASGVYLWRVESTVDGKNGKVMVIR